MYFENKWCCLPAVPGIDNRFREKLISVCVGNEEGSLKIRTHNSKEPSSSLTEVKFLSNPTKMTDKEVRY